MERPSLGHSPILTMPPSSPEQIFLNDEKPKYTLKQLKRTMNSCIFFFNDNWYDKKMLTWRKFSDMSKIELVALFSDITTHVKNFYNYIWLFFEIHMQKIIFISVMLLCVNDVSLNRIEDMSKI